MQTGRAGHGEAGAVVSRTAGQRSSLLLLRRLDAFLSILSIEVLLPTLRTLALLTKSPSLRVQRSISGVKQQYFNAHIFNQQHLHHIDRDTKRSREHRSIQACR